MSKRFKFDFVPKNKEAIMAMSNEDLMSNLRRYRRMIKEARHAGKDPTPFEIEYCYLDHERQMRERYFNFNRAKVS